MKPLTEPLWLLGYGVAEIRSQKLPSNEDVLKCFVHYHFQENKPEYEAARIVLTKCLIFYKATGIIHIGEEINACKKIKSLYQKYRSIKNRRRSKSQYQMDRAADFQCELSNLFDLSHKEALQMTPSMEEKDKEFLIAQRKSDRQGSFCSINDTGID